MAPMLKTSNKTWRSSMSRALWTVFFLLTLTAVHFGALSDAHAQNADWTMPEFSRQKYSTPASDALRGTAEAGFGILFGTLAGSIPLMTGLGIEIHDLFQYRNPFYRPFIQEGTMIATAIAYPLGVASGVILGGYLTDSQSHYWEPFVGAFSGALIADVTAYFLQEDYPIFSALLVILLPVVTTVIAVETSHAFRKQEKKEARERAFMPIQMQFSF